MNKILFIQPTQYDRQGKLCKQKRIYLPGLVFPLLSAITPENWQTEICLEVVDEIDYETDADIIGIGAMGFAIFRGLEIAREFKKRNKLVVMGGYMASMVPDEVLKHVDSVIVGDGEKSYLEMLADFEEKGQIKKLYQYPAQHLNNIPIPKYEQLIEKPIGTMLPVQAGRGCPHTCSFCSIACIYKGKYLSRPIDDVYKDILRIKELGYKNFYLIDDNIVSNPGYLKKLSDKIRPLKMRWASQCSLLLAKNKELLKSVKKSGAFMMSFGIETITQKGLEQYNKSWLKVNEHEELIKIITDEGILVSSEMIIGTDSDTEESIKETFQFIERCKIPIPRFYIITPMPGSQLYSDYKKEGRLLTEDYTQYDGSSCVFKPKKITAEKLTEMYWWLNQKTFSFKSILKRTLFHPKFIKAPFSYLFAFGVNLHYRKYVMKKVPPNIF